MWEVELKPTIRLVALAVSVAVFAACSGGGPNPGGAPSSSSSGAPSRSSSGGPSSSSPGGPSSSSAGPTPGGSGSPLPAVSPGQTDVVVNALFTTMATEGHNPDPTLNDGLGALYINWRHGTNPLVVNVAGGGQPDPPGTHRHDPLIELRYLDDLWVRKSLHPDDATTTAEIARYTPIVQSEFAQPGDKRGWTYDLLMDLARTSGDPFYRQSAQFLATYADSKLFHADIGAIYAVDATHPTGFYRTDEAIDTACALIQAGTDFNHPEWAADGKRALDFAYSHAFLASDSTFLMVMQNVTTASTAQTVARYRYRNENIDGGVARLGEIGTMALSLLHAAKASGDPTLLAKARQVLDPLTASANTLGLWDATNGGYFSGIKFPGSTQADPGVPTVERDYKESGRQTLMLQAFHLADSFPEVNGAYLPMEQSFTQLIDTKIFYKPGQGVLYQMAPDWQPYRPNWTWVTSEAMDVTLEALLSLNRLTPW